MKILCNKSNFFGKVIMILTIMIIIQMIGIIDRILVIIVFIVI